MIEVGSKWRLAVTGEMVEIVHVGVASGRGGVGIDIVQYRYDKQYTGSFQSPKQRFIESFVSCDNGLDRAIKRCVLGRDG